MPTHLDLQKGNALVIVAHPDDETIWLGGVILMNPQIKWTIFSLCRRSDKNRVPKFRKVCKFYGVKAIISDLEDKGIMGIKESVPMIKKLILDSLRQKSFNYIFTHGANGEYGHPRHKGVYYAIQELIKESRVSVKRIFYFAYHLDEQKQCAVPDEKANISLKLSLKIFRIKREVVEKMYGFSVRAFEYKSSTRVETFNHL